MISAPVAADLLLLLGLLNEGAAYTYMYEGGLPSLLRETDSVDWFLFLFVANSKILGGMVNVIVKACGGLQSEAEELQDVAATNAKSIGEFYGSLYMSIPLALAALKGLRFVAEEQKVMPAPEGVALDVNVLDERATVAMVSMEEQFANALDFRCAIQLREWINLVRKRQGEDAAEDLADQAIETEMKYPAFERDFLLSKSYTFINNKVVPR